MKKHFVIFTLFLSLFLAACSPNVPKGVTLEHFSLFEFFKGKTTGEGYFENLITGEKRSFSVTLKGTQKGQTFSLYEAFTFEDGEKDEKTWVFTTKDGQLQGTREDVIGVATLTPKGKALMMEYLIKMPDAPVLRFKDILYQTSAETVVNEAIVSKFGVPIAKVRVDFKR